MKAAANISELYQHYIIITGLVVKSTRSPSLMSRRNRLFSYETDDIISDKIIARSHVCTYYNAYNLNNVKCIYMST